MPVSRQSKPSDPRANQKQRTREALLAAAGELLRRGLSPTVADAAGLAKVSRATAYRYFPTQEYLLIELAQLTPALKPVDDLLADMPSQDPEERLRALLGTFNPVMLGQEVSMRTVLRAALDAWLENRRKGLAAPVREGRRVGWLDTVLEPVRKDLTKPHYRRLRSALALTLGIDSLVILKDACGLGDEEALEVLDWAATALLRAGLAPAQAAPRRGAKRPA
jgi:AcrR family transcriptional regulator